jgi:hypothetical protein
LRYSKATIWYNMGTAGIRDGSADSRGGRSSNTLKGFEKDREAMVSLITGVQSSVCRLPESGFGRSATRTRTPRGSREGRCERVMFYEQLARHCCHSISAIHDSSRSGRCNLRAPDPPTRPPTSSLLFCHNPRSPENKRSHETDGKASRSPGE